MSFRSTYLASVKSDRSDEWINTWLLRPIAGLLVWPLSFTPVTPNQVTIASTLAGLAAAWMYGTGHDSFVAAGLLVTLKDLLDSADGQLARAKKQYSRIGRFLDSIGDFVVDVAVFAAIGWTLYRSTGDPWSLFLAAAGFVGISLRVSCHVFYQVQFLHLQRSYENNRVDESVTERDRQRGGGELVLQRIFQLLYGWQDRLMGAIDGWCRRGIAAPDQLRSWYEDPIGLRLTGLLGFGTELFLLMLCSVAGELRLYLLLNLAFMNGIWLAALFYRRRILSTRIIASR